ncbi:hypothetical protein M9H77_07879 [Catharanthus roseus]|uniref:Uncharacterized protein n=1 Tax=Catharanthus roseus TaxID=4058 RepID=A0ACC0BWE2_CATRO|nr:hypothetical protein M9H77_07879 [Catharanthus roseus]
MEDDLHNVEQALEGFVQHLSCLKGVKDLRREEEAILEQSSRRRNLGGHPMHSNEWAYGNRLGTRNGYHDTSCKRVPRNDIRNGGNYVNIDEWFHKRKCDYEGSCNSYNYGGYNCGRNSQTFGTTFRPLSYNNLKLPVLCGTFGPYDY